MTARDRAECPNADCIRRKLSGLVKPNPKPNRFG